MTPIDIGAASSASAGADSGKTGAFNVSGGATKSNIVLWIVLGVVALVGGLIYLRTR